MARELGISSTLRSNPLDPKDRDRSPFSDKSPIELKHQISDQSIIPYNKDTRLHQVHKVQSFQTMKARKDLSLSV